MKFWPVGMNWKTPNGFLRSEEGVPSVPSALVEPQTMLNALEKASVSWNKSFMGFEEELMVLPSTECGLKEGMVSGKELVAEEFGLQPLLVINHLCRASVQATAVARESWRAAGGVVGDEWPRLGRRAGPRMSASETPSGMGVGDRAGWASQGTALCFHRFWSDEGPLGELEGDDGNCDCFSD